MSQPKKIKKPVLRGGKGTLPTHNVEVVRCRNHNEPMRYDPLIMGWECPVAECNYRRYKKSEIDQYGPPLVCEGPYTLTLYKETADPSVKPRVLLRGSNNVVVDLTSLARELAPETGHIYARGAAPAPITLGNQTATPSSPLYVLELAFEQVTVVTQ